MKKIGVIIILLFLILPLITAISITSKVIDDDKGAQNQVGAPDQEGSNQEQNREQTQTENYGNETEIQNRIRERIQNKLTDEQIRKIFTIRNRLKNKYMNQSECPRNCTCTGSATKCFLGNRSREMTITAGKSGNVIIQVKGINASTEVTLYKSDDGKLYAVNKNNETKIIRMLPDQVRERIRERLEKRLENENISLDEDGYYLYQANKRARLFAIFPVKEKIEARIDPETGLMFGLKNPWWGFLARDEAENIVGASCGTVTPGENDNCCKSRGYDYWNSVTEECGFEEA